MAFTEGSNEVVTNGGTPVIAVPAPAGSTRRVVRQITVINRDTVDADVTLTKDDGTTDFEFVNVTLSPGDNLIWTGAMVLPTTSYSINAVLGGAITTNELHIAAEFGDVT